MLEAKSQFSYFESLQKMVKVGLVIYLIILLTGTIVTLTGAGHVAEYFRQSLLLSTGLASILLVGTTAILLYSFNKIHWLGDVHVWLDQTFFGFLKKSNDLIFRELTAALDPQERGAAFSIEPEVQGSMAESIFKRLSDDETLFEILLQCGIFRLWIWYWILTYGTFVFTLLSIESFTITILGSDSFSKTLFTTHWLLALIHLGACIFLGYRLLDLTRETVGNIVKSHRFDIADILRDNIRRYRTSKALVNW